MTNSLYMYCHAQAAVLNRVVFDHHATAVYT